jgi:phosphohistidine swiveling domain-containing protein
MNVVDLRSPHAKSLALCGGKGAELAALLGDELPVPDGFIVTTAAFCSFLEAQGLATSCAELRTAGSERSAELAEQVRRGIAAGGFPVELEAEISRKLASFEDASQRDVLWAVRSSAIAEDTDSASFAGQYETTLGVNAAGVPEAVLRSWSSMFSERAVRYREERGATDDRMAVVVQLLLRPSTAGVCFTIDPVSGDNRIVINANYGLGESVAGGYATPDTYVVDGDDFSPVSKLAGDKKTQIVAGELGVETTDVPADKQSAFCLSPAQVGEVAKLAAAVEARHGQPVDIEWAYEEGTLFLLQARPITSRSAASVGPPPDWKPANNTQIDERYPLYSNGNISEVMPGCVSPLSWDHTGRLIEHAFRSQLGALGAIDPAADEAEVLGFFFHRPYVNVSLLLEAAARTPGMTPDTVREEFIGKPETTTPAIAAADFLPHRAPRLWRVVRTVLSHSRQLTARIEGCRRVADADALQVNEQWLADASDEALLEMVRMSEELGVPSVVHVWASTLASVAFTQLRRRTASWLGDEDGALASELVTGIDNLPSAEPALELHALSERIAGSKKLAALFRSEADDGAILDALRGDPLHVDFEDFLRRYGHRGVAEAELNRPCWREDPAQLVSLIRNNLRPRAVTPIDVTARQRRAHREALNRLEPLSWWRRKWLTLLVHRARAGFLNRETMKDLVIRRLDRSRVVYRELNRRLVARGLTSSPDDIFFLLWSEVKALADSTRDKDDIAEVIEARRRDYRWSRQVEVPKLQEGTPRTLDAADTPDGLELDGMGVSPGRVTGVARVVTDPRSGAHIEPGEILVAPVTDVAWTPLFAQAAGLVVEVGGLLSHGSIVAREYGVPAVVGVAGATKTIRTGDRITLDGATGRVFKLAVPEGLS